MLLLASQLLLPRRRRRLLMLLNWRAAQQLPGPLQYLAW
jgi:hypothetical protein